MMKPIFVSPCIHGRYEKSCVSCYLDKHQPTPLVGRKTLSEPRVVGSRKPQKRRSAPPPGKAKGRVVTP